MNNGLLLACQVENVTTRRDGTLKLTLGCQELNSSKSGDLVSMQNKICGVYITQKETISQSVIDQVDSIDVDLPGKTKSQRQRNILFRIWEVEKEGHKTFESFYAFKMEQHILELKEHLQTLTT